MDPVYTSIGITIVLFILLGGILWKLIQPPRFKKKDILQLHSISKELGIHVYEHKKTIWSEGTYQERTLLCTPAVLFTRPIDKELSLHTIKDKGVWVHLSCTAIPPIPLGLEMYEPSMESFRSITERTVTKVYIDLYYNHGLTIQKKSQKNQALRYYQEHLAPLHKQLYTFCKQYGSWGYDTEKTGTRTEYMVSSYISLDTTPLERKQFLDDLLKTAQLIEAMAKTTSAIPAMFPETELPLPMKPRIHTPAVRVVLGLSPLFLVLLLAVLQHTHPGLTDIQTFIIVTIYAILGGIIIQAFAIR